MHIYIASNAQLAHEHLSIAGQSRPPRVQEAGAAGGSEPAIDCHVPEFRFPWEPSVAALGKVENPRDVEIKNSGSTENLVYAWLTPASADKCRCGLQTGGMRRSPGAGMPLPGGSPSGSRSKCPLFRTLTTPTWVHADASSLHYRPTTAGSRPGTALSRASEGSAVLKVHTHPIPLFSTTAVPATLTLRPPHLRHWVENGQPFNERGGRGD